MAESGSGSDKKLSRMSERVGTPQYLSPEILKGDYGIECDLWSAGVVLYLLLCGYPPFYGDNDIEVLKMVMQGKVDYDTEEWDEVSDEALDLVQKLLCPPSERLTAKEAIKHPWFKKALGDEIKTKSKNLNKKVLNNLSFFQKKSKL